MLTAARFRTLNQRALSVPKHVLASGVPRALAPVDNPVNKCPKMLGFLGQLRGGPVHSVSLGPEFELESSFFALPRRDLTPEAVL